MFITVFDPRTGARATIAVREPQGSKDREGGQPFREYTALSPIAGLARDDVFERPCAEEGSTSRAGSSGPHG